MNAKAEYRKQCSIIRKHENLWRCDPLSDVMSYREFVHQWTPITMVEMAARSAFLNNTDELEDRQMSNELRQAAGYPDPFVRFWFGK